MRVDTSNFIRKNKSLAKEARYVVQLAFDTAATDLVYFRSHDDGALPSGATYSDARCFEIPAKSQTINPIKATSTIGNMQIRIQDTNNALTDLIYSKLAGGDGLRHKRVRVYLGYRGLDWADYTLFHTQRVDKWSYKDGVYTIDCKDIQRSARKEIFIAKRTVLDAELDTTAAAFDSGTGTGTITVKSTTDFSTVYHGAGWDDAPSSTVGYIKIDDEVIRYTGKTATTFTGCTGGVLGTRRTIHTTDTTSDEKKKKVEEFIYLDLPCVKMIYSILTGELYNDAATLPDHWHLGMDAAYVATSVFTSIGSDIWDTTDETTGARAKFIGLKKTDGKKFLEQKLYRMIGCTPIIYNDGQIGILRLAVVTPDAPYHRLLNESNIISYGELVHDAQQVYNTFVINWNYVLEKDEMTRQEIIVDSASITAHQASDALVLDMDGLNGSRHTSKDINKMFDFLRARYTGPPKLLNVECLFTQNDLSVGDIVHVELDQIRDSAEGVTSLSQSFEIQQKVINTKQGTVSFALFGSSELPTATSPTIATTALASGMYSTTSLQASNKLDANPGGITTSLSGGVLHITTATIGTLTGAATIPGTSNSAVYWYDGDVQLDDNATINITENVVIMVQGFFQINGTINGKGQGATGAGYFGTTLAAGGLAILKYQYHAAYYYYATNVLTTPTSGTTNIVPDFNLTYEGGTSFSDLMAAGFPTDLRGTGGGNGATSSVTYYNITTNAAGGSGANGGAGLALITQGVDAGVNAVINLSGADGLIGSTANLHSQWNVIGGSGAGGAPGVLAIFLDGSSATETDMSGALVANLGDCPRPGQPFAWWGDAELTVKDYNGLIRSRHDGYITGSQAQAAFHVQYIPAPLTAVADSPLTADKATGLTLVEVTNTPQTPAQNLASIEVSVTSPGTSNYSHTNIYWKLSGDPDTSYTLGGTTKTADAVLIAPMDGTSYDIKAVPVSIYGIESPDFDTSTIVMSTAAGGATLATGNYIQSGQTAYDTGTGFFIGNVGGTPQMSIGNSAGNKVTWNGSTLAVTGTVTATVGAIGGWSIGSTALTSGSGGTTVGLDSGGTNPAIYAGSSTPASAPFRVTNAGAVTSTSGTIGGWTLGSTTLTGSSITLDASNNKISINSATFGNPGIQLEYYSTGSVSRMYCGDGADKFIMFDGTDTYVGRDAKLLGAAAYNNDIIFYDYNFGIRAETGSSGGGSNTKYATAIKLDVASAGNAYANARHYTSIFSSPVMSWAYDRRVKIAVAAPNGATSYARLDVGTGNTTDLSTAEGLFFTFDTDGNLYSQVGDGTTNTKTSLQTWTAAGQYLLEIVWDTGVQVKFYVNGTLKNTQTTNIPSGTTNAHIESQANITYVANSSYCYIGRITFEQQGS